MLRKLGNLNSVLVKAEVRIFVWVFFYKHAKRISTGEIFLWGGKEKGCSSIETQLEATENT